jgi:hypothetical protein
MRWLIPALPKRAKDVLLPREKNRKV